MSDESTDATHDPSRRSWVKSANASRDFPIQNLPFGIFATAPEDAGRTGIAIGDFVLDLPACFAEGLLEGDAYAAACGSSSLNLLMSLGDTELKDLRRQVSALLGHDTAAGRTAQRLEPRVLHRMADVSMRMPAHIGDYSDFYASIHHATNVGSLFRPDNPLLPNYKHVPIGYHGRASSIVPSGTDIRRPAGQTKTADAELPSFGPSRMLDYEAELGFFVRRGNPLGDTIPVSRAREHLFGFCLVNDWSARDVQAWEYQPLGPFLAKNFATTISPWVVTAEAVEPYRIGAPVRSVGDPEPLPYLMDGEDQSRGGINAFLEVHLVTRKMRDDGIAPVRISRAPFASMYWTVGQMLAHHASNGCNLRPGDLLASGTVSGSSEDARGCLLELTWRGNKPITLPSGESRKFLEDGDEVIMRGSLEAKGRATIGFGECRGTILPATG